jgi:hypothetical protein
LLTLLILLLAAVAGGCNWPGLALTTEQTGEGLADRPASARWTVATAFARAEQPAIAAARAVEVVRRRMGTVAPGAVIFFECFDDADSGAKVSATIQAAWPTAEVIGCSAAGVATPDGFGSQNAVGLAAIGGDGLTFSSAYAPPAVRSAQEAGRFLSAQLGQTKNASGQTFLFVLADPATAEQESWDPADLVARLMRDRPADGTLVLGGLASPRGRDSATRIHHAGRSFAAGVAALQIAGPLTWQTAATHEMLRVGPVLHPKQIAGRIVGELVSPDGTLPAQTLVSRWLIAQDRLDGQIGRFIGELPVPLGFKFAADSAVELASSVQAEDRLILLRPAPAESRMISLRQAAAQVPSNWAGVDGPPIRFLALPCGAASGYTTDLPAVRDVLSSPQSPAASIAFMGPGQFAPVPDGRKLTCQFSNHLLGVVELARKVGGIATSQPMTQPSSRPE